MYIAMRLYDKPTVNVRGTEVPIILPAGCKGICFIFDTVEALEKWQGKGTEYVKTEFVKSTDAKKEE